MSSNREIYRSSSREGSPTREGRRTGGEGSSHDRTRKQPEWQTQPASEAASSMTGTDTAPHQASDENNDSAMNPEMRKLLDKAVLCKKELDVPNLKYIKQIALKADIYGTVGKMAEMYKNTSPENKQAFITHLTDQPSKKLHQLCKTSLERQPNRKWTLDSVHAILDQRADQDYNIKSLDMPTLVSFIRENKADQERQWAVDAAKREGIRRNNAKYSQNN